VTLDLELETTYDAGEVRTSTVAGAVAVTVIYSSITG
jgi:hypothetical protein